MASYVKAEERKLGGQLSSLRVFARVDIARDIITEGDKPRDGYWIVRIERCLSSELFFGREGSNDLRRASESFGYGLTAFINHYLFK
jgi:hypothetical protein